MNKTVFANQLSRQADVPRSMKFLLHHERLIGLYWEHVESLPAYFDEGGGIFKVASRSCEGLWHKVVVTNGEGCCTCQANFCGSPCLHLAICAEALDDTRYFQEARIAEYADITSRLATDPKLLAKYRKVYAKFYPAVEVAPVVCEGVPF
jgi:hypothetical protein